MLITNSISIPQHPTNKESQMLASLSSFRGDKVKQAANEGRRRQLLYAGFLLEEMLREAGGKPPFTYQLGEHGKPFLTGENLQLLFSISHTAKKAVCAVSHQPVGIDVERIQSGKERVGNRFFLEQEMKWIMDYAVDESERSLRFIKVWTFKESMTKALGTKLTDVISKVNYCDIVWQDERHGSYFDEYSYDISQWQEGEHIIALVEKQQG